MNFVAHCPNPRCKRKLRAFSRFALRELYKAHVDPCLARAKREAELEAARAAQGVLPL